MQALILAGGEGTRLRPLTETMPKPVLPLAGKPFTAYTIEWLSRHGVTDVVISCGFLAEGMREALAHIDHVAIRFVEESEPLGTAGAIRYAQDELEERFLALNGDVLTDVDLGRLLELHERAGARATIGLYPVDDPSAYGLVRRDEDGEITEFLEKPDRERIDTDEINAGAYVLERAVLDLVPAGEKVSIERDVFPRLVGDGLFGCRLEGYWLDIGTPERFLQASRDILEGAVETSVRDRLVAAGGVIATGAEVSDRASVTAPALIGAGATVAAGARVSGPSVIGAGSRVGAGARIDGAVLFDDCEIGPGALVRGAILAAGVEVAEGAEVGPGEVLGEGARA